MKKVNALIITGLFAFNTGCISVKKDYPDIKEYSFQVEHPQQEESDGSGLTQFNLRSFTAASRYEERGLVYRMDDARYESDYYNRLQSWPAILATELAAQWFAGSNKLQAIAPELINVKTEYLLQGKLIEMYGDFRDSANAKAVIEIEFTFLRQNELPPKVLFQKRYSQTVPLTQAAVGLLIEGFKNGFQAALEALEQDMIQNISK